MERTFRATVVAPVRRAYITATVDVPEDEDEAYETIYYTLWDLADHKDSVGELNWEIEDWTVDVLDWEEVEPSVI
jgi:hypothetical protein